MFQNIRYQMPIHKVFVSVTLSIALITLTTVAAAHKEGVSGHHPDVKHGCIEMSDGTWHSHDKDGNMIDCTPATNNNEKIKAHEQEMVEHNHGGVVNGERENPGTHTHGGATLQHTHVISGLEHLGGVTHNHQDREHTHSRAAEAGIPNHEASIVQEDHVHSDADGGTHTHGIQHTHTVNNINNVEHTHAVYTHTHSAEEAQKRQDATVAPTASSSVHVNTPFPHSAHDADGYHVHEGEKHSHAPFGVHVHAVYGHIHFDSQNNQDSENNQDTQDTQDSQTNTPPTTPLDVPDSITSKTLTITLVGERVGNQQFIRILAEENGNPPKGGLTVKLSGVTAPARVHIRAGTGSSLVVTAILPTASDSHTISASLSGYTSTSITIPASGTAEAPTHIGIAPRAAQIDRLQEQIDLLLAIGDPSSDAMRTLRYLQQRLATLRPDQTRLLANYPNPFNPETWIPYQLKVDTEVRITIYNAQGVVIRTLQLGQQSAGYYTDRARAAYWDGRNAVGEQVASGIYFYQFETDELSSLRKMVILK